MKQGRPQHQDLGAVDGAEERWLGGAAICPARRLQSAKHGRSEGLARADSLAPATGDPSFGTLTWAGW
jgi:hypothetical protein